MQGVGVERGSNSNQCAPSPTCFSVKHANIRVLSGAFSCAVRVTSYSRGFTTSFDSIKSFCRLWSPRFSGRIVRTYIGHFSCAVLYRFSCSIPLFFRMLLLFPMCFCAAFCIIFPSASFVCDRPVFCYKLCPLPLSLTVSLFATICNFSLFSVN